MDDILGKGGGGSGTPLYDLYGNVLLDRVSVSNPQRLTSTQILVHYPPPGIMLLLPYIKRIS